MDERRFDTMTKALAAGRSRRGALGLLAGAVGLAAGAGAAERKGERRRGRAPGRGDRARAGGTTCDVCASGCPYRTLADAIDGTPKGGTITLCTGTFSPDPQGLGGFTIARDLTIQGASASNTIIDGLGSNGDNGPLGTVLTVSAGAKVTLQRLTIRNGYDSGNGDGGGISNAGDLTLVDVTVSGNTVTDGNGGGIANQEGATLTLRGRTTVSSNIVNGDGSGAGVYTYGGSVTLTDQAAVVGNRCLGTCNQGGGIFVGGGTVALDGNSRVNGNKADSDGGDNQGGGVYLQGGHLTLDGASVIANNVATARPDSDGDRSPSFGGGIYIAGGTATLGLPSLGAPLARVTGNTAEGTRSNGAAKGGGIYLDSASSGGRLVASPGQVVGNTPDQCGPDQCVAQPIRVIADVCAKGCRYTTLAAALAATPAGGQIQIGPGTYPTSVAVEKSVTIRGLGAKPTDVVLTGGNASQVLLVARGCVVTVANLTIRDGKAGSVGDEELGGGGVWNEGNLTLRDVMLRRNFAVGFGGGVYNGNGGDNQPPCQGTDCTLTLAGSTLVTLNVSASGGGGILNDENAVLNLNDGAIVSYNSLTPYGGFGGGIINLGTLRMSGQSWITRNTSRGGGGVYSSTGSVTMSGSSRITGNAATDGGSGQGGGIFLGIASGVNATLTMRDDAAITGNRADAGGGVWLEPTGRVSRGGASAISGNTPDDCAPAARC